MIFETINKKQKIDASYEHIDTELYCNIFKEIDCYLIYFKQCIHKSV